MEPSATIRVKILVVLQLNHLWRNALQHPIPFLSLLRHFHSLCPHTLCSLQGTLCNRLEAYKTFLTHSNSYTLWSIFWKWLTLFWKLSLDANHLISGTCWREGVIVIILTFELNLLKMTTISKCNLMILMDSNSLKLVLILYDFTFIHWKMRTHHSDAVVTADP